MSGRVVGWAFDKGKDLTPTERYVLVALADNADQEGRAWPSKQELAEKTGLNLATIYRALKGLGEKALFEERVEAGRDFFYLLLDSQSAKTDSQSAKENSQSAKSTNKEPSKNRKGNRSVIERATNLGFCNWLTYHGAVTGIASPKLTTKAAQNIAAMYCARISEGYSLQQIKDASLAAYSDNFRRENGHYGHESVLRPTKIHDLSERGRHEREAASDTSVNARAIAELRARGEHEAADELESG